MSGWRSAEQEIPGEIMKTDVFVKVVSDRFDEAEMQSDITSAFAWFRDFESRFSRFRPESELSVLNASTEANVSEELFSLLDRSSHWFRETDGIFDPSILPALCSEGYVGSFGGSSFGISPEKTGDCADRHRFDEVRLDAETKRVRKPMNLKIDLGGIGKGYAVDRVADVLRKKYEHFFVCAGGDIFACGRNAQDGYDFWAVDVENPIDGSDATTTLLLSGKAVATSGTERRKWTLDGGEKHHLIDTRTGRSAQTDLASVSVVGNSTEEAEIWAKTLCILGSDRGVALAEKKMIPSIFIRKDGKMITSKAVQEFLWKA